MVITDFGLLSIVRVDPSSGDRTTLSNANNGNGPSFIENRGIAIEDDGTILVTDSGLEAVVQVL